MISKKNIISYGRFSGASWFEPATQSLIFVGGAGGIGSHLTFFLARTGAHIVVVDPDVVSEENLAGQLYGKEDIGKKKVRAIADVIGRLCGETNVTAVDEFITKDNGNWQSYVQMADVVCVGFDNLTARRIVYDYWKANGKEKSLFIDGRLNFEEGDVFPVDKHDPENIKMAYEATYFGEDERTELPCTMKATTHCGSLIANLMTCQIVNWLANTVVRNFKREVMKINMCLPVMMMDIDRFKPIKDVVEVKDAESVPVQ